MEKYNDTNDSSAHFFRIFWSRESSSQSKCPSDSHNRVIPTCSLPRIRPFFSVYIFVFARLYQRQHKGVQILYQSAFMWVSVSQYQQRRSKSNSLKGFAEYAKSIFKFTIQLLIVLVVIHLLIARVLNILALWSWEQRMRKWQKEMESKGQSLNVSCVLR